MNNLIKIFMKRHLFYLAGVVLLFSLSSCLKNNENTKPNIAALSVIHASPGLQKFDFLINNQRINSSPFDYSQRLPYFNIYGGIRTFGIYKAQSTDSIKLGSFEAKSDNYYSIYVIGQAASPQFLVLTDSLTQPSAAKANVRFLNLSPDAPALNLSFSQNEGQDSTLFSNLNYKSHSAFVGIGGGKTYTFKIKSADQTTMATVEKVNIESGRIYTIWSKGLVNSINDTTKIGIIIQPNI